MLNTAINANNNPQRPSVYKFAVDLIPTLNRATVMSIYAAGKPVTFAIRHDKRSAALQFQPDPNNRPIRSGELRVNMFRNFEACPFANTFFELENVSDDGRDVRGQFIGTKSIFSKYLLPFTHERYDFATKIGPGGTSNNYMIVDGWKTLDANNDLIFMYVQRAVYNDVTRMHILRSAGIQFSTARGEEILKRFSESLDDQFRRLGDEDDLPEFLRGIDEVEVMS